MFLFRDFLIWIKSKSIIKKRKKWKGFHICRDKYRDVKVVHVCLNKQKECEVDNEAIWRW